MKQILTIRNLGYQPFEATWQMMRRFTDNRGINIHDEFWWVEHPSIFTLGQASSKQHILKPGNIPIVPTDRGGEVTYHGPGQLVIYLLINLKNKAFTIHQLIENIQNSVIELLHQYGIVGHTQKNAPGVYIENQKICSLALRVRKGCTYHGLSFNINMELEPFKRINPCGFLGLKVTQLADRCTHKVDLPNVAAPLTTLLAKALSYNQIITLKDNVL